MVLLTNGHEALQFLEQVEKDMERGFRGSAFFFWNHHETAIGGDVVIRTRISTEVSGLIASLEQDLGLRGLELGTEEIVTQSGAQIDRKLSAGVAADGFGRDRLRGGRGEPGSERKQVSRTIAPRRTESFRLNSAAFQWREAELC